MSEFVLDCSVALSWCFPDESDAYALSVREAMRDSTAHVPAIWWLEFANGLIVAERKGRLSEADSAQFLLVLGSVPIVEDLESPHDRVGSVVVLGRHHQLSAYDAGYLELAIRRGIPIATLDERLRAAARQAGVALFQP